MALAFGPIRPILRMYDLAATTRFYLDYLGCTLDFQDGEGDRPIYLQVSRGDLVLHLSSHVDDGTPGSAVLVEIDDVEGLWRSCIPASTRSSTPRWNPVPAEGERCN